MRAGMSKRASTEQSRWRVQISKLIADVLTSKFGVPSDRMYLTVRPSLHFLHCKQVSTMHDVEQ